MDLGCGTAMLGAVARLGLALALLLGLAPSAAIGGGGCSVQATVGGGSATEVPVGEEVLIEGFGFTAAIDVFLTYDVEGTVVGSEAVVADASGLFEATVVPQAGEEGLWTVTASVPKECTATTGFLVVGSTETASPDPTSSPAPPTAEPTPVQSQLPNVAIPSNGHESGLSMESLAGLALTMLAVALARRRLVRNVP